jgi:hypothetical protein
MLYTVQLSAAAVDRLVISRALAQALLSNDTAITACCFHTPAVAVAAHTGNTMNTVVAAVLSTATCSRTAAAVVAAA